MQLYIHVPFCRQRCNYCAFYSMPLLDHKTPVPEKAATLPRVGVLADTASLPVVTESHFSIVQNYVAMVCAELRARGKKWQGSSISSVFFGGGTPSLLSAHEIESILDTAADVFCLAPEVEITVEANPESMTATGWLHGIHSAGVNRVSMGVQSFDDRALRLLGRVHSSQQAVHAFNAARQAGFENINIDLMWGVPSPKGACAPMGRVSGKEGEATYQKQQSPVEGLSQWMATLEQAVTLQPEHISAYGLTLESGTPLARLEAEGKLLFPGEIEEERMFIEGGEFLEGAGYGHYEISNFSQPGKECLHNLGYWGGNEYLGVGPAATSTLLGERCTNPANLVTWYEAVKEKGHAGTDCEIVSKTIQLQERLMLSLRTRKGLDLAGWNSLSGRDFFDVFKGLADTLQETGLARCEGGFFALSPKGMFISDGIISSFFTAAIFEEEGTR